MANDDYEIREIKLKTLSHLHIGNGETLQKGIDFIEKVNPEDEGYDIYVLDYDKVGKELQADGKSMAKWVEALTGNHNEFLKVFLEPYASKKNCKRILPSYCEEGIASVKEYIHDGVGLPYLPGSSIKGAVRTAIFCELVDEDLLNQLYYLSDKYGSNPQKASNNVDRNVNEWVKKNFGDISQDMLKYLQVGDAYFGKGDEVVLEQININQNSYGVFIDKKKKQAVEAIPWDIESSFRVKLIKKFSKETIEKKETGDKKEKKVNGKSIAFRQAMDSQGLPYLFRLINNHSKSLVKSEIEYWDGMGSEVAPYVENLHRILETLDNCKEGKECVLRIGEGSGWKFITGAWTERLDEEVFNDFIVPMCRPQNYKYEEFVFPKTRRVGEDLNLFGFVKLSIE